MKIVATAIAIATAALTLAPTSACAEEPTRVLVVGDSVTQGIDGDYTWRYFAATELAGRVDFVGPRQGTLTPGAMNDWSGDYAAQFDVDHAARWGMSLTQMQDAPDANSPSIERLVTDYQPDVIVEQLGVNDFDREGLTAEQMAERVIEFVSDARAVNPDVDVVLGSIPQAWIREVGAYNALLPDVAARISTDASRVVVTPVADFVNGVDTYDFAHPTKAGQEKLAVSVVAGLAKLGVGTSAPAEAATVAPQETATAAPAPSASVELEAPRKIRAQREGRQTVVTWRKASGSEVTEVRCGGRVVKSEGRKAAVRSSAKRCSVRAVSDSAVSPWSVVRVKR